MLDDMEFESAWNQIKEEDRPKFLAQQLWDLNKHCPERCRLHLERFDLIDARIQKLKERLNEELPSRRITAITGAGSGMVASGTVIAIQWLLEWIKQVS